MATLSTPQTQAGVLSFYDAPEKGPIIGPKVLLIAVAAFAILIVVLDHFITASF
jgi:preprotein translocase subunit Sec61beta